MTKTELDSILRLDGDTGRFYWIKSRGRVSAGSEAGYVGDKGYIEIGINGKKWYAHILVWLSVTGSMPGMHLDHRDTDRANNKFENLRLASQLENTYNRSPMSNNKSGVKGVHWHQLSKKWRAVINVSGKRIEIGKFTSLEKAARAMAIARDKYHGEFARH